MVAPKVVSSKGKRTPKPQQDFVVATPPPILSSYYILLIVKILLVLIILFTLPKLVTTTATTTTETAMTMIKSTTKERRRNSHHPHSIYQRYKYKLRSLRDDCQNNPNQPCAILIPEESLNCVNECMSVTCYQQVYHSTTTPTTTTTTEIMEHPPNDIATTTTKMMIRLPLENGEIDVARAKEFDLCVMHELRQAQLQPRTASSE